MEKTIFEGLVDGKLVVINFYAEKSNKKVEAFLKQVVDKIDEVFESTTKK